MITRSLPNYLTAGIALLLPSTILQAQDAFTFETSADLFSVADLDGDGRRDMVVVEKATGITTLGFQEATGSFSFSRPAPSGIETVTSVAVGKFVSATADSFLVTGPSAGRLHLISAATASSGFNPSPIYPAFPSSHSLAAMDLDGSAPQDVVVIGAKGSIAGGGPFPYAGITSLGTTPSAVFTTDYPGFTNQTNPARVKVGVVPRMLSSYSFNGGVSGTWYLEQVTTTGASNGLTLGASAAAGRVATGIFDAGNLASFLFYTPGSAALSHRKITETAGVFGVAAVQNFTLPKPILLVVPQTSAAVKMLAVLHSDGTMATYDFNGSTAPVLRQTLPGSAPQALVPLENGGLLGFTGGPNPSWTRYNFNGSTHSASLAGNSPAVAPLAASVSNVIYFSEEPMVIPTASSTGQGNWREWTTSANLTGSVASVTGLVLGASTTGLAGPLNNNLTTPAGTNFALVNQYRADASIFSLSGRVGREGGDVNFSPSGGTYPETPPIPLPTGAEANRQGFVVRISPTVSGDNVFYRTTSTSVWTQLSVTGAVLLPIRTGPTLTTTVEAYSQGSANRRSPIRSATYVRTAEPALSAGSASVDTNGNGVADAWEKNFAITNPGADEDGDGANNASEYAAGTDPRNALSKPAPNLILTGAQVLNGGQSLLRLEWPASDSSILLETSPDLQGPWIVISSGITISGANYRYEAIISPAAAGANFFRLRRP